MALLSDDDVFGSAGKSSLLSDDDVFGSPKKQSSLIRRAADVPIGLVKGVVDLPGAAVGLLDIPTNGLVGKAVDSAVNPLGEVADSVGIPKWARPTQLSNTLSDLYSPEMKQAKQNVHEAFVQGEKEAKDSGSGAFGQFASGVASGVPAILKNPSAALALATENYGGMKAIAKGTAHMLAPAAAKYAEAVKAGTMTQEAADAALANAAGRYSAINEGLLTAGQNTQQIENENPNATFADRAMQGIAGAITGGISRGVSKIPGLGDVEANMALREVGAGAKNSFAGSRLAAAGKSALSEGVLEEFPQSIQEQVWQNLATNKAWNEGLSEQAISGLVAGSGMGAAMGALNGGSGSRYVAGKINTKPNEDQPPIAGLLPSPTYTGTPGGQIVENDAARQADIDAADKNAAELYAMRDAFERSRQNVTLVADPVPVQQRIDAMLGLDADRMDKQGRAQYEKDLAAAFNEPIGVRLDENQNEVPFTMGEYLDAQVRTEDIVRARPLRANANEQSANRLAQIADEESQQHAAIVQDLTQSAAQGGALSQAALTGIQTGATRMPTHPERAAIEQQMLADEAAQRELAPIQRLMQSRTDEQIHRIANNEKATQNMRQAAVAEIQRRMTTQAQPTTTSPLQQTATQFTPPNPSIKMLQTQLDKTEPFSEASQRLTGMLQTAVSKDAQKAIDNGEIPVYRVTDHVSVAIHPSAQNPGMVQVTRYTKDGVIGDSQYNNIDEAVTQEGLTHKPRIPSGDAIKAIEQSIAAEAEYQQRKGNNAAQHAQMDAQAPQANGAQARVEQGASPQELGVTANPVTVTNVTQSAAQPSADNSDTSAPAKRKKLKFSGNIINDLKVLGVDPNMIGRINTNGVSATESINDLNEVAERLRSELGYIFDDVNHDPAQGLVEYLRRVASGEASPLNAARIEADIREREEYLHKQDINERAAKLGLKKIGGKRTLQVVEAEVAAKEQEISELEAREERAAIQTTEIADEIYKEGSDLTEADLMQWLGTQIEYSQDEINEADSRQFEIESRRAETNAGYDSEEQAQGGRAERAGTGAAESGARQDEGFGLASQSPEELRAKAEQDRKAAAQAHKEEVRAIRAEQAAKNKAEKDRRAAQVLAEREAAKKAEVDKAAEDFALGQAAPAPVERKVTTEDARGQQDVFAQQTLVGAFDLYKDGIIGKEIPATQVPNGNESFQYALGKTEEGGAVAIFRRKASERGTYGGWRWEAQEPAQPVRGEVGASLTKAERAATLKTLIDVYRQNRAPKEFKGLDANGNERYGYAHSPEYFVKSDITGSMVRYYVTLPDGRVAHPTELFSDYTQANIDAALQKEIDAEREQERNNNSERERLLSLTAPTINEANGKFNNAQRFAEDRDSIVPALLTNGELYLRSRPENADKAASLLGEGWRVEAQLERGAINGQKVPEQTQAEQTGVQIQGVDAQSAPVQQVATVPVSDGVGDVNKEPWQMTRDEFEASGLRSKWESAYPAAGKLLHDAIVGEAQKRGLTVPLHVRKQSALGRVEDHELSEQEYVDAVKAEKLSRQNTYWQQHDEDMARAKHREIMAAAVDAKKDEKLKKGTVLYHGTQGQFSLRDSVGTLFLTTSKNDAIQFGIGIVPGHERTDDPRLVEIVVTEDSKVKDINSSVEDALMNDDDVDSVIVEESKSAKSEGYDFVHFKHPSIDGGDMDVWVSTNSKNIAIKNSFAKKEAETDGGLRYSKAQEFTPDSELIEAAKKHFMVTHDVREAGYILPDGTMLDFSGKHYANRRDWPYLKGVRNVDHRELTSENTHTNSTLDRYFDAKDPSDIMQEFMVKTGAMRVDFNAGVSSIMRPPTAQQIRAIGGMKGWSATSYVDPDNGRIVADIEFENTTPAKVKAFFEKYVGRKAGKDSPLFSSAATDATQSAPFPRAEAEYRIKSILGDKLGKVLIESGIVTFTNKGNEYQGATYKDGSIALNLDALNADNFAGVLQHEGFHSTIRDLVGEQTYTQMMKRLDTMLAMGKGAQWVKDANAAIPSDTKAEHRTEEIAAYSIEQYVNGAKQPNIITRWVESLLSALRTAIIRRLPFGKLKSWAVNNLQPQDLANLAIAGLKAKARGQLQAQGREAMAFSRNENGANVSRMADKDTVAGTQAPTSAGDGSTGSAKAPHIAAAEQILSLMDDPVYTYGLRVLPSDFTDPVKPREIIPSSFVWQDGDITDEEIDGVSTAGIRRSDLESVLAAMKNLGVTGKNGPNGYYFGSRVVLVRGDSNGSGQDVGETIIRDPEVLGEWKKPNNGLSEVMPNEPSASAGSDADIRYSRAQIIGDSGRQSAFDIPEQSRLDDVIYAMQDKQVDLRRVVQSIKKAGGNLTDSNNAYLQEELFHGRASKGVQDFLNNELRPLVAQMRSLNVEMADFEEYLWNRHAEERNKQISKINDQMPDGGSGIKTADARAYLNSLDPAKKSAYESLAKRINAINRGSQEILVNSGLEKQETIDAWNGAYSNYVPLHREDVDTGHVGTGKGYSIRGSASKRAVGSNKPVVDILANLAMQRERNIVRAEKNRVSNALYGLAVANPNSDLWQVDEAPTERVVFNRGGKDEVVTRIVPGFRQQDNVIHTRINGEDHFVIMDEKNPRAIRMAQSIKNLDMDQLGRVLSSTAKATRYMAAINTQFNPVFGIVNLARDTQGAMLNLSTTPLAGKQKKVLGYTISALRGIYADLRDHRQGKTPSSSWAKEFEEFQKAGGQTGYRDQYSNAAERADAIAKELKSLDRNWLLKRGGAMFDWLSDYNESMENAVRLASFKAAKESGMSVEQAASLAKNLTVNFNRKGQVATQMGALYAFFNASVQGTARLAETMAGPMGKKILYGGLLLGSMQAMLLAASGMGDDEPPEFVRERSIIIPIGDGKYISIPMPLGFHVIPNLSRIPTEFVMSGFKEPAKRVADLFGLFADTFNPIGNAGLSLQTISPTVIDPLAALSENRDWTGKPIAKLDRDSLNPTPGYLRTKDTATSWSRAISYGFNLMSGGTDYKKGLFSPTPDQIDYLIGQATGGVGREVSKAEQTGMALATGEELPMHKIPLFGRFIGDTTGQSAEGGKFYASIQRINEHENEIKGLRKEGNADAIREYIKDNPEAMLVVSANHVERDIQKLKAAKREAAKADNTERVKAIELQITNRMKAFNDRVRSLSEKNAA